MKKKILPFIVFAALPLFADDAEIFGELNSAYKSSAFPSAVEYAVRMEKEYPRSVFLGRALRIKGECLYYLSRYDEAIPVLEEAVQKSRGDISVIVPSYYFKGKAQTAVDDEDDALNSFYSAMKESPSKKSKEEARFYFLSESSAARIFHSREDYDAAVMLLEDCISNGNNFEGLFFYCSSLLDINSL